MSALSGLKRLVVLCRFFQFFAFTDLRWATLSGISRTDFVEFFRKGGALLLVRQSQLDPSMSDALLQ